MKDENIKEETQEETINQKTEQEKAQPEAQGNEEAEPAKEETESERYARLFAEFQNYKKRTQKERLETYAFANENLISDLLPVLDNFERALDEETIKNSEPELLVKGFQLVYQNMSDALTKAGLKKIECLGEKFDPRLHNAVLQQDSSEFESGVVCQEMQAGYTLNDKVIRPSMVAVAK